MFSLSHWLIIILVIMIVFGAGRLPRMMGDIGKGIKSLKEGLHGNDEEKQELLEVEKIEEPLKTKSSKGDKKGV